MATLRNDGGIYSASGRGHELKSWPAGESREVSDEQAAHVLTKGCFTVVAVVEAHTSSPAVPVKKAKPKRKPRKKA